MLEDKSVMSEECGKQVMDWELIHKAVKKNVIKANNKGVGMCAQPDCCCESMCTVGYST
jgi:hypothetical protein